ncbi:MAG: four helix bundle protein, partial [Chlorobium limicola]|nr:four helix bundle protein [Chlorobium limicola]
DADYETFRKGIEHADPEVSANVVIWLVKVTTFLLDTQLQQLEQTYLKDGGLRERMYNARLAEHSKPKNGI